MVTTDWFDFATAPKCGSIFLLLELPSHGVDLPRDASTTIHLPPEKKKLGPPSFTVVRPAGDWLVSAFHQRLGRVGVPEADAVVDYVNSHETVEAMLDAYPIGLVSAMFRRYTAAVDEVLSLSNLTEDLCCFLDDRGIPYLQKLRSRLPRNQSANSAHDRLTIRRVQEINDAEQGIQNEP